MEWLVFFVVEVQQLESRMQSFTRNYIANARCKILLLFCDAQKCNEVKSKKVLEKCNESKSKKVFKNSNESTSKSSTFYFHFSNKVNLLCYYPTLYICMHLSMYT